MKYKVLKDFVSRNGVKCFHKGDEYSVEYDGVYTTALTDNGFIEPEKNIVDFDRWEKEGKHSKLANVIIALEDYEEGDKKYFTWQEAMDKVEELDNGWRLPTNKEWSLIAWEFGEKDDLLDSKTLRENLNLELKGYQDKDGRLRHSGVYGYGWSRRANTTDVRYAYYLGFNASGVAPSSNGNRWVGFPLRLVKDIK